MRLEVRSAWGEAYHIDSLNPELLARWLLEIVARIKPDRTAPAQLQAWPSIGADGRPDWLADARVLGRFHTGTTAPELLEGLAADLAEAERFTRGQG
jgi:hypothetical protein